MMLVDPDIRSAPPRDAETFTILERAQTVADVAAAEADAVDRTGSFPTAAIEAARDAGLFGLIVPSELGGAGARIATVADVCYTLGQACASTAMIVAMHTAALACVVRHHGGNAWQLDLLRRTAAEGLLFASSTTEGTGGGNVRSSDAALVRADGRFTFQRAATVMSYGAQADVIVSVARRDETAAASDQVAVVLPTRETRLTGGGGWDTLGMRGTCSGSFSIEAEGTLDQVLPAGYDKIHALSMVPVSHLVWSSLWTGIAAAAVARAQGFTRMVARKSGGQMPPGASNVTRAAARLRTLRRSVAAAIYEFERIENDERALAAMDAQAALNLFKVETSDSAFDVVLTAVRACGLAGYRNDGPYSVGRNLRDVLSASLMINNERIMTNIAPAALMSGVPSSLFS